MLEQRNTTYSTDGSIDTLTRYVFSNHLQSATLDWITTLSPTKSTTLNDYASWKEAVSHKFGNNKFTVPQKKVALFNYGGMTNKGTIRLNSRAQYRLTIFWKTN